MTPIHQRDLIRAVRNRWLDQYKGYAADREIGFGEGRARVGVTRARLAELDPETCSVADVDKAIGTKGWVSNDCDECGKSFPVLIRIGSEPDYDARWQDLCAGCLSKAATLAADTNPQE